MTARYKPNHYLSDFRLLTTRRRRVVRLRRTRWWWTWRLALAVVTGLTAGSLILVTAIAIYLLLASL